MKSPKSIRCAVILIAALLALSACAPQPEPAFAGPTATPPEAPVSLPLPSPTPVNVSPSPTLTPEVSYGSGPGDPSATPAPTTATVPPDSGMMETMTITLDNSGSTLKLKTGQRFLLKLGETYDWNLVVADQSVVSRVKGVMVIRGAQGLFEGLNPGQSEVSAMGDPVCRSQKPACGQPSVLFRLTVIVE